MCFTLYCLYFRIIRILGFFTGKNRQASLEAWRTMEAPLRHIYSRNLVFTGWYGWKTGSAIYTEALHEKPSGPYAWGIVEFRVSLKHRDKFKPKNITYIRWFIYKVEDNYVPYQFGYYYLVVSLHGTLIISETDKQSCIVGIDPASIWLLVSSLGNLQKYCEKVSM